MAAPSDDIAATLRESGRPGALDTALIESKTTPGKMTWKWDSTGDLIFDDSASYPVLISVLAHRGEYRWDRTLGTLLHKVTRERSTTGSQLAAYARDGGAAAEVEGVAKDVTARARKLKNWRIALRWTAAGKAQMQEITI